MMQLNSFQQMTQDIFLNLRSLIVVASSWHMDKGSVAVSLGLDLGIADVKAAFLQGLRIGQELYFLFPNNLGGLKIRGLDDHGFMRPKRQIYVLNDASRA
eukprot:11544542-Karenia_brevis.AAC.1